MKVDRRKPHLTAEAVVAIRRSSEPYAALAQRFNVSLSTIKYVRWGRSHQHVVPRRAVVPTKGVKQACLGCDQVFTQRQEARRASSAMHAGPVALQS